MMKILVLGGGGREHALVWKLKQSPRVDEIFCIPGNAGIEKVARTFPLSLSDHKAIADFVREKNIDLTVIGPEQPLVEGLADYLESLDIKVFGPGSDGARIEGSKVFAKNFMMKYHIPTAHYAEFSDYQQAADYLQNLPAEQIVVKADGLAAGKGSIVCGNRNAAEKALQDILKRKIFGTAGEKVIIEEFMEGEEASLFVITDGKDYVLLSPAQDFKRALDDDRGKNTGGMGSYAPTPVMTTDLLEKSVREVVEPTLEGLRGEGILYQGVLYCGLMLTKTGPRVVEFNCRFGDPETQVVLPLLDCDLAELLMSAARRELSGYSVELKSDSAVCVIAASGGYPDAYEKGKVISGLDRVDEAVMVFHAGTQSKNHHAVTAGGRVLGITATGKDLKSAVELAYRNIRQIHFEGMHYRSDIAARAIRMQAQIK
jgi:phosphoribosylamine--glycine ligase